MSGESVKPKLFPGMTWLKAGVTGLALSFSVVGSVYLVKSLNFFDYSTDRRTLTTGIDIGSSGDRLAATGETGAVMQGVGGDATVDASRHIYLFANAFRPELIEDTEEFSSDKKIIRDQLLDIIERLVGLISLPVIDEVDVQQLAADLASLLASVSISPYRLTDQHFTLEPGTAYFLPGGDNAIAFIGPAEASDPKAILVRRNGRKVTMQIGSVREFRQGNGTCRLILHTIADETAAASFSYTCDAS